MGKGTEKEDSEEEFEPVLREDRTCRTDEAQRWTRGSCLGTLAGLPRSRRSTPPPVFETSSEDDTSLLPSTTLKPSTCQRDIFYLDL